MFCPNCGTQNDANAEFCSNCGTSLKKGNVTTTEKSGSSFGWGVLGFFIPLVGLILFLTWKQDRPKDAKAAGIGALISVIAAVVFYIIIFVLAFAFGDVTTSSGIYY